MSLNRIQRIQAINSVKRQMLCEQQSQKGMLEYHLVEKVQPRANKRGLKEDG